MYAVAMNIFILKSLTMYIITSWRQLVRCLQYKQAEKKGNQENVTKMKDEMLHQK